MPRLDAETLASIRVRDTAEGAILPVQAQPGAKRNGLTGVHNGRLKIAVTQAAEKGKANKELGKLLADLLHVRRGDVELCKGPTATQKEFLIRGMTAVGLQQRLRECFEQS